MLGDGNFDVLGKLQVQPATAKSVSKILSVTVNISVIEMMYIGDFFLTILYSLK